MLDKIIKVNNNQAHLIYTDGRIIGLVSDKNVDDLIMVMILPYRCNGNLKTYLSSIDDTILI